MISTEYITFIWIGAAVLFAVLEALTLGLTSIWFAGGAIVACIVSIITENLYIQIGSFVVASVFSLIATRPIARKHMNSKLENTNICNLIGMRGIVVTEIKPMEVGAIRANGKVWSAISAKVIQPGTEIKILSIKGVTVTVEPV